MMNRIILILAAVAMALLQACSGPESFNISGEVKGGGNINLYLKYYADDAVRTAVTAATGGKFSGDFQASTPALVELLDNDSQVLARFYAVNGDQLQITVDRTNPALSKVTGTPINEQFSALVNANADLIAKGDAEAVNRWIEGYITDHPADPVSSLIFASFYDFSIDPVHAGEVLEMIATEARLPEALDIYTSQIRKFADAKAYGPVAPLAYLPVGDDDFVTFDPKDKKLSLVIISNENSRRNDSVVPHLRRIYKDMPEKKSQMLDLVLYTDSHMLKGATRRDSAGWKQGWVPGGILGPGLDALAIPEIPYYIVIDSGARQIYRGPSPQKAETVIADYVKGL